MDSGVSAGSNTQLQPGVSPITKGLKHYSRNIILLFLLKRTLENYKVIEDMFVVYVCYSVGCM